MKFVTGIVVHATHELLCLLPLPLSTFLLLPCSTFLPFPLKLQKSSCKKNGHLEKIATLQSLHILKILQCTKGSEMEKQ
jgi:hypothetical protein